MRKIAVTLLAACLALPAPDAARAQEPAVKLASATLADRAFMAGCWRGEFANGGALEEVYTAPSSNLMLGLSRYLRGESTVQFEFSRITADSSGITLLPFPGGRPSSTRSDSPQSRRIAPPSRRPSTTSRSGYGTPGRRMARSPRASTAAPTIRVPRNGA